jgi:RNase P/RNase MRP subunit POP5
VVGKMKRLKLKPSARDKRRYFLVKAPSKDIEKVILKYVGVFGLAKSAYVQVDVSQDPRWDLDKGLIVGSCLVGSLNEIRAALGLERIDILKVSGTLKGLRS